MIRRGLRSHKHDLCAITAGNPDFPLDRNRVYDNAGVGGAFSFHPLKLHGKDVLRRSEEYCLWLYGQRRIVDAERHANKRDVNCVPTPISPSRLPTLKLFACPKINNMPGFPPFQLYPRPSLIRDSDGLILGRSSHTGGVGVRTRPVLYLASHRLESRTHRFRRYL